jgi:hypothetical protein
MTCQTLMIEKVPVGPTRYRNVVLTSWDRGLSGSVNSLHTFSAYVIGVHLETTSTSQPAGVRLSFKVTFDGVPGAV